jgi:hypothetical protein
MPKRPRPALRAVARTVVGLVSSALLLTARDVAAQRTRPTAANDGRAEAESYRLTMPVLRRVLPVLHAPGVTTECPRQGGAFRDVDAMPVTEMQAVLDRCAPVRRAAAAHGVSTREVALAAKALMRAGRRITEEESAKVSGGTPAPLSAGALRDNVLLVRQNEAEIGRLSRQSQ